MDLLVLRVILLEAFLRAVVHGRQAQLDAFGTGQSFGDCLDAGGGGAG